MAQNSWQTTLCSLFLSFFDKNLCEWLYMKCLIFTLRQLTNDKNRVYIYHHKYIITAQFTYYSIFSFFSYILLINFHFSICWDLFFKVSDFFFFFNIYCCTASSFTKQIKYDLLTGCSRIYIKSDSHGFVRFRLQTP